MILQDKVIFLTGGSMGIGFECAKVYANEGAKVVICAKEGHGAVEAAAQLEGEGHIGLDCDISVGSEVEEAIVGISKTYGQLDAIHNNAGIASPAKPLHETSEEEWDRLMDINMKGVYWTTRYGFDLLKETKGCILNTSSLVGVIGQDLHCAYTGTKGGMNALTKSMALDYAPFGIRVNAICPAGTWTPLLRKWVKEQPEPELMEEYLNEIHAMGYCPEGDVIADASAFLLSEKARFITGHIMHVTGGAELGYRRSLSGMHGKQET